MRGRSVFRGAWPRSTRRLLDRLELLERLAAGVAVAQRRERLRSVTLAAYPPIVRRALVAVLAAVVVGCGGADSGTPNRGDSGTATSFDRDLGARLQRTLDEQRERYAIPGASAAVIVTGKGLWAGASGKVSRGGAPVTADTLFNAGSVTKTFVAALVLDLADEGVLRLDDAVARWLPAYPRAGRMTVRQLLNHTSGLADFVDNPAFWEAARQRSPKVETVEGVLGFTPAPLFEPGDGWAYSNAGYLLLGRVVERATRSTVGRELNRRLLEPLGLHDVLYAPEQAIPARFAHGYVDVDEDGASEDVLPLAGVRAGRPTSAFGWADGGVVATARDLARWGHALYGGKVLVPAQFEQDASLRRARRRRLRPRRRADEDVRSRRLGPHRQQHRVPRRAPSLPGCGCHGRRTLERQPAPRRPLQPGARRRGVRGELAAGS